MTEDTIGTDMPRETPETKDVMENHTLKLKLFMEDYDLAHKLQVEVSPVFRLTLQEILRDAIHAGLPLMQKRYKAAIEASIKAAK
jgi:hypothetical protein